MRHPLMAILCAATVLVVSVNAHAKSKKVKAKAAKPSATAPAAAVADTSAHAAIANPSVKKGKGRERVNINDALNSSFQEKEVVKKSYNEINERPSTRMAPVKGIALEVGDDMGSGGGGGGGGDAFMQKQADSEKGLSFQHQTVGETDKTDLNEVNRELDEVETAINAPEPKPDAAQPAAAVGAQKK